MEETIINRHPQKVRRSDDEPHPLVKRAKAASIGLEMGISVLVGWGIGYYLDGQLGTTPWLMVVFLLFGVAAGFRALFRTAQEAKQQLSASNFQDDEEQR